jgi:MerR family transcriptional regulator, light-induced transcriptional regulator
MASAVPAMLAELRERYVDQLIAGDAADAQRLIGEALRVVPVATVYHALLAESLYEIGRRWARGEVTVAEEHLATGICEVILPDLAVRLPRSPRFRRTVIVACAPGELHALGSRIVADFLEAAGWDILHLGALTPADALAELVVARGADVVAMSATTSERLPEAEQACARLRQLPFSPLIVAGGQAFAGEREALGIGADVFVRSPEALCSALAERFPVGE